MNTYRSLLLTGLCTLTTHAGAVAQQSVIWQEKPGTWSLNVGLGASRYLGDLNDRFDLAHLQTGLAIGAALTYRVTDQLALRGDLSVYSLRGTQTNTTRAYNNLSFHSVNPDVSVGVQYSIWASQNRNHARIPYGIAGVGVTYMTPRTMYKGIAHSLAPLHTEAVAYSRLPLILRYGVGLPLFSTNRLKGNVEGIYTHVRSDYLDDVSRYYPDRSGMAPLAAALSDRGPEVGSAANGIGARRGNSRRNDGYMTVSARLMLILSTPRQRNYRRMFGG